MVSQQCADLSVQTVCCSFILTSAWSVGFKKPTEEYYLWQYHINVRYTCSAVRLPLLTALCRLVALLVPDVAYLHFTGICAWS